MASVAQFDICPTSDQRSWIGYLLGPPKSFVEMDHKIFSMVILSLPLIQEGQLSVSGERMCTSIG